MDKEYLTPIIAGDEITSELRRRRSKDRFQTIKATNKSRLAEKVKLETEEGWKVAKKNKKSTRMAKEKPGDEQLEDEIWCMLARMGFKELSHGRQFTVSVRDGQNPRQIDVFAKDDETTIIVECTHRKTPGRKNMSSLIEKIQAIRGDTINSIRKHYGRESALKFGAVIATRNIDWSEADLEKCANARISVLTDGEIDYYNALIAHLKKAARYQFLAHIFGGQKIEGLVTTVLATRGKMGGNYFYTFMVSPDALLKIAYVGHKASRDTENIETYQRMLQSNRLRKIAEYINEGGKFPTNIVLNLKTKKRNDLRFEVIEKLGNEALGKLHLPPNYASAWVIDGQHRLYGYAYAREGEGFKADKTTLPVLAFENLPSKDEMDLFIDINSKQVKVSTSLLVELYAELHWGSDDSDEAYEALLSRIASKLNSEKTSPLRDRMVVSGKKKTPHRCLTQTSIRDGLEKAKLIGSMTKDGFIPGPLSTGKQDANQEHLKKSVSVLSACLNLFAEQLNDHWNTGDGPGGYLCTNIGVRAIFHVIKDIADHYHQKSGHNLCYLSTDETISTLSPYLQILVDYFKDASPQEIQDFRGIGSSLVAVRKQSFGMEAQINEKINEFCPVELREYLDSRDEAGTHDATILVNQIHSKLSKYVIDTLKKEHGEENKAWWTLGIPKNIRIECAKKWEEENRKGEEEGQLLLINYKDICLLNWELFKDVISFDARDKENKRENIKWIIELNEIRRITAHPERGVLNKEQVIKVNEIYEKLIEYLPE